MFVGLITMRIHGKIKSPGRYFFQLPNQVIVEILGYATNRSEQRSTGMGSMSTISKLFLSNLSVPDHIPVLVQKSHYNVHLYWLFPSFEKDFCKIQNIT